MKVNTLVSSNLFDFALIRPLLSAERPDSLRIVSGYASHAMAAHHLITVSGLGKSLDVDLIYGMAGADGVRKTDHIGFQSLENKGEFAYNGSFACSYVKRPVSVHSKVYVWCRGETPIQAFVGSANYSDTGFSSPSRTETLAECDPVSAFQFFVETKRLVVPCSKANLDRDFPVKLRQVVAPSGSSQSVSIEQDKKSPFYGCEKITLSLLDRAGTTGNGSGLNWGVRPDGDPRESHGSVRDPNQAYLRYPVQFQRTDFMPAVGTRFTVMTDDSQIFTCTRAQSNGKGIHTPQDNDEIGRYFRSRLGLPDGAYVTVADLKRYGRFEVTFYKLDNENYVMDFSKPSSN